MQFVSHRFARKLIAAKVGRQAGTARRQGLLQPCVEPCRMHPSGRCPACPPTWQIAFKLHVVVGPTDSDSVCSVILKKAQVGGGKRGRCMRRRQGGMQAALPRH